MSERGMKKWAPYKSLSTQYEKLHEMRKGRNKVDKPLVSSDKAEEINSILINHNGEPLLFSIYQDGEIMEISGVIKEIDTLNRSIILVTKQHISLKNLVGIKKIQ